MSEVTSLQLELQAHVLTRMSVQPRGGWSFSLAHSDASACMLSISRSRDTLHICTAYCSRPVSCSHTVNAFRLGCAARLRCRIPDKHRSSARMHPRIIRGNLRIRILDCRSNYSNIRICLAPLVLAIIGSVAQED